MISTSFPSFGSASRSPLPSTGSQRVGSPASPVLRGSLTPRHPSHRTVVSLVGWYRLCGRSFAPAVCGRPRPRAWIFGQPEPTRRCSSAEMERPPRFLEGPSGRMPCSSTPAEPSDQAIAAFGCCRPSCERERPRQSMTFEAHSHGLRPRCLRFADALAVPPTQDSLPAGGQPLPGGNSNPPGPIWKVSGSVDLRLHPLPPSPGFAWRTHSFIGRAGPRCGWATASSVSRHSPAPAWHQGSRGERSGGTLGSAS